MLKILIGFTVFTAAVHGQDLVRIPAGTYEVADQITSVKLRVTVPEFLIGATEITQREYEAITSSNPSFYKGADRPVENVSWWDAIRYLNLRSAKEGLSACYDLATGRRQPGCTGYRLPTEAEWTTAAAPSPGADVGNLGVSSTKSVSVFEPSLEKGTTPVRSFEPNKLGLYDMRGNVWEWCGDYFDALASPDAIRDPWGPPSGLARVIRGGSFVSTTSRWSRDYRSSMNPELKSRFTGLRVARNVEAKPAQALFIPHNQAPQRFASSIGPLTELASTWKQKSAQIKSKWETLLQEPKVRHSKLTSRLIREVAQRNFAGQ